LIQSARKPADAGFAAARDGRHTTSDLGVGRESGVVRVLNDVKQTRWKDHSGQVDDRTCRGCHRQSIDRSSMIGEQIIELMDDDLG
jgi:hypothetical protein